MLVEQFGPAIEAIPGVTVLACPFRGGASIVSVILLHRDGLAVVDAGVAKTLGDTIEPQLAARGLNVKDVRSVVLTHADGDHAGSTDAIRAASGAALLADPLSADRLGTQGVTVVEDGDTFEAGGFTWQGLHTPGHRNGMLSVYAPSERLLIVSDSVQGHGTPWARFPLVGFSGRAYRHSTEKLLGLDVATIVLGHPYGFAGGEPAFVQRGAAVRAFLEDTLDASREIEAAVAGAAAAARNAGKDELIATIARDLAPSFGLVFDDAGAPHSAVLTTLESELRDIGRA